MSLVTWFPTMWHFDLCNLLLSLETPNDVRSVALESWDIQATSKGSDKTVCLRRLIWAFVGRTSTLWEISCYGSYICITLINLLNKLKYGFYPVYPTKMAAKMAIPCLFALVVTITIFNGHYFSFYTVGHYAGPMLESDSFSCTNNALVTQTL